MAKLRWDARAPTPTKRHPLCLPNGTHRASRRENSARGQDATLLEVMYPWRDRAGTRNGYAPLRVFRDVDIEPLRRTRSQPATCQHVAGAPPRSLANTPKRPGHPLDHRHPHPSDDEQLDRTATRKLAERRRRTRPARDERHADSPTTHSLGEAARRSTTPRASRPRASRVGMRVMGHLIYCVPSALVCSSRRNRVAGRSLVVRQLGCRSRASRSVGHASSPPMQHGHRSH